MNKQQITGLSAFPQAENSNNTPQVIEHCDVGCLSPIAQKLIEAVEAELGPGFTARHEVNQKSPSYPYKHRTIANRDSLGTGPKEKILIGKHVFYSNSSLVAMLREDMGGAC